MYGVDLAMMKEPSQVSAVVRETQSMRMSRGKISLAYVHVMLQVMSAWSQQGSESCFGIHTLAR
jgi:peptidyl-tRNA hydrolase